MKAKDLARLLDGVHPDADVYIDLGLRHNKRKELIYKMLTDYDFDYNGVENIEISLIVEDGVKEVFLLPYEGEYDDFADKKVVESFFEEHGLNEIMEKAFDEA